MRAEAEICGKKLVVETGSIARQADGAVWVQMDGTVVLVTVVSAREPQPYQGFFPLTVDYRERAYAAGKIPGGFFKREGKPYDHEILRSRLIDRPLRPMFPDDYNYETQVLALVTSYDQQNDPDVLGIFGASAAIAVSDIPLKRYFGAVRVAYIDGEYVVNPTVAERDASQLDLVVAGTGDDIVMVEGGAYEVPEDILLGALKAAMPALKAQVEFQLELAERFGKPKRSYEPLVLPDEIRAAVEELAAERMNEVVRIPGKLERNRARKRLADEVKERLAERFPGAEPLIELALDELEGRLMRRMIVVEGRRTDGRDYTSIRPIDIKVGVLPRAHGSALFTRGETQALAALTLGTKIDEQKIEDLEGESWQCFIHHLKFPPV